MHSEMKTLEKHKRQLEVSFFELWLLLLVNIPVPFFSVMWLNKMIWCLLLLGCMGEGVILHFIASYRKIDCILLVKKLSE